MVRLTSLAAVAALLLGTSSAAPTKKCGDAAYDPDKYVCRTGNFLCPVIAGEPLSSCGAACYSKFQYQCKNGVLAELPHSSRPVTLVVSNPAVPALDGRTVNACGLRLWAGGATCSYCPSPPVPVDACPAGTVTSIIAPGGMNTMVPGGQRYFLDPAGVLSYTQAHSGVTPDGSTLGGTVAYRGGGLVNVNEGALGWRACPEKKSTGPKRWSLVAATAKNLNSLKGCTAVNLKVAKELPSGQITAWQYT